MPEPTNEQLVALAKSGDANATTLLIDRNTGLMFNIIRRTIKSAVTPELANEFLGIAVEGMLSAINGFDPTRGFRFNTYAGKAIWSKLSLERKRWLGGKHATDDNHVQYHDPDSTFFHQQLGDDIDTVTLADRRDRCQQVMDAIRKLERRERFIIRARLRGVTLEATSHRINVTRERVRQLEMKAKGKVRLAIRRRSAARP